MIFLFFLLSLWRFWFVFVNNCFFRNKLDGFFLSLERWKIIFLYIMFIDLMYVFVVFVYVNFVFSMYCFFFCFLSDDKMLVFCLYRRIWDILGLLFLFRIFLMFEKVFLWGLMLFVLLVRVLIFVVFRVMYWLYMFCCLLLFFFSFICCFICVLMMDKLVWGFLNVNLWICFLMNLKYCCIVFLLLIVVCIIFCICFVWVYFL